MPAPLRAALGGIAGGLLGFAIYRFVGCRTGACPLSGNPWVSTLLWGLLGVLMAAGK